MHGCRVVEPVGLWEHLPLKFHPQEFSDLPKKESRKSFFKLGYQLRKDGLFQAPLREIVSGQFEHPLI